MAAVARQMNLTLPGDTSVDAEVDLNLADGAFFPRARLSVHIPGLDRETAQRVADAAHQVCPYSKATRGNIDVTINVV